MDLSFKLFDACDNAVNVLAGRFDILGVQVREIEKSIKSGSIKSKGNKFKFGGPPKQIKSLIKISDIPMERPNKGGVIIAPETITTILDEQHENDLEYIEALIDEENE